MNKLTIIGNLVKDPELRSTQSGKQVCSFTVAVNRRAKPGEETKADFFRVNAWNQLGENCGKYLTKGKKVAVVGSVSVSQYTAQDGKTYANLDVLANEIEFLSPKEQQEPKAGDQAQKMIEVSAEDEELPF